MGLFEPTGRLLTFHKKVGELPPLVEIEENATEVPAQNGFVSVEITMLGVGEVLVTRVIEFEIAGLPLTQTAFDMIVHVTISPPITGE
jgi:hypothetical protein